MTAPGFENEYARPDRPRRSTQGPTVTMVMTGFVGGCVAAALVWLVMRRRSRHKRADAPTDSAVPVGSPHEAATVPQTLRQETP